MRNIAAGLLAGVMMGAPVVARAADCAGLANLKLVQGEITMAAVTEAGRFVSPYGQPLRAEVPKFCRVAGVLRPTADSNIRFEVWMPASEWNGRLLGVGNGGFAGSISYDQMGGALKQGYATTGTDTGHEAQAEDASWAYRHPEKIADFGWRGLHLTALAAKAVIAAYYGNGAKKSYFDSCSNGGREALMEAQRFPEDYDGILAGAPANNWTRMLSSGLDITKTVVDPEAYVSSMKLPAITKAVLEQCDAQDGVKDGVLNDPRTCHFNPAVLLCKGRDSRQCLTEKQVGSVRKLYGGGGEAKGHSLFPGYMPGDEWTSWATWVLGSSAGSGSGVSYMQNYFRYMVFDDPKWNPLTADVDAALRTAEAKTAKDVNSVNPDLMAFAARGGKLVMYHGWDDPAISPLNSIAYYESMQKRMGEEKVASFAKLYMVPGMEHCIGGPGANLFGQLGAPSAEGTGTGALADLQEWVEMGKPIGAVIAVRLGADSKPVMTRPLCPYPQVAKYKGSGDGNDAANFACGAN
jgi:feruloyl esterase